MHQRSGQSSQFKLKDSFRIYPRKHLKVNWLANCLHCHVMAIRQVRDCTEAAEIRCSHLVSPVHPPFMVQVPAKLFIATNQRGFFNDLKICFWAPPPFNSSSGSGGKMSQIAQILVICTFFRASFSVFFLGRGVFFGYFFFPCHVWKNAFFSAYATHF